jgi:hypothetical protein
VDILVIAIDATDVKLGDPAVYNLTIADRRLKRRRTKAWACG